MMLRKGNFQYSSGLRKSPSSLVKIAIHFVVARNIAAADFATSNHRTLKSY